MTVEELKVEAKKLGYRIIKDRPTIKLQPCPVCGSKRTREWVRFGGAGYSRECDKCDFKAEPGSNMTEARLKWNEAVNNFKEE